MNKHILESYLYLVLVDLCRVAGSRSYLRHLEALLRRAFTSNLVEAPESLIAKLCHAIDLACVFYPKQMMCLERSAATTILLRRHGVAAEMVVGVRPLHLKSHAWVEVSQVVVNDKPYVREIYQQLHRW